MTRTLKIGDTVFSPRTSFNSGETWLEENRVKAIDEDSITLTHVADWHREGDEIIRREVIHKDEICDKKTRDYLSRPLEVIMKEYKEENDWLVNRFLIDAEKYQQNKN